MAQVGLGVMKQLAYQDVRKVILPVQRALGPLQCQRLGLGWVQKEKQLSLLFDGDIHLDVLSVDLYGLSIGIPVGDPGNFSGYDLDLDGLGLTLQAGQVEVSAAFVKLRPDAQAAPPRTYTEYDGEVLIKAGTFAITANGSYAYVEQGGGGFASLFIFGALDGELGGPAFFFVTGIAAGFGYNRALILPDQNGVTTFPLFAAASDPSTLGGLPPDPAKALRGLGAAVPPERGEYWLAASVRFTSFDLINTTALLVVEFGNELEIALLGVSRISLPPPGGRVHINWYVISFTVGFGADDAGAPPRLEWTHPDGTGFSQTLLPHKTQTSPQPAPHQTAMFAARAAADATAATDAAVVPSGVYTIMVSDGLISTLQKGGEAIWSVRPNHFTFSAVTAIPTPEVDVSVPGTSSPTRYALKDRCGADYTVYIRPMNAQLTSSVFSVEMRDQNEEVYDLVGDFDFDFSCHPVPAAKWGAPLSAGQDPEMNSMLPGRLLGLENITPKQPTPAHAWREAVRPRPFGRPGRAPGDWPGAQRRLGHGCAQLLAALQGYGFDPVTNSPMTTLAADPGAVLVGSPTYPPT